MKYALAGAFDLENSNVTVSDETRYPTLDLITVNSQPEDEVIGIIAPPPPRTNRRRATRNVETAVKSPTGASQANFPVLPGTNIVADSRELRN